MTKIVKETREKIQQVENIKYGNEEPPDHQDVRANKMPKDFFEFNANACLQ